MFSTIARISYKLYITIYKQISSFNWEVLVVAKYFFSGTWNLIYCLKLTLKLSGNVKHMILPMFGQKYPVTKPKYSLWNGSTGTQVFSIRFQAHSANETKKMWMTAPLSGHLYAGGEMVVYVYHDRPVVNRTLCEYRMKEFIWNIEKSSLPRSSTQRIKKSISKNTPN